MIKKGIKVKVLVGKDKNKEGEIIEIDRSKNRVKVKEINMVKKHVKTTKEKWREEVTSNDDEEALSDISI